MTPEQFQKHLKEKEQQLKKAMEKTIPEKVANKAVLHFKKSFQNEGFTDSDLEKWKEVQRRIPGTKTYNAVVKKHQRDTSRGILTGRTANLGRSIKATHEPGKVTVFSDVPYAAAHNEGTTNAGRNRNVTIPKRQFIGKSETLEKEIERVIVDELDNILKK